MKKADYINEIRNNLRNMPSGEVEDIIRDQEEHIREAMAAGRSEEDVIARLGDPKAFAANLTAELKIQEVQNSTNLKSQLKGTLGAVAAILALAPLNLIFVLGPFLALISIAFSGWAVALSGVLVAVAIFGVFFLKLIFVSVGFWAQFSTFFFALGTLGGSVLGLFAMYFVTQWLVMGTIAYLKWNLNFIKARS